jgi:hypothetical protein
MTIPIASVFSSTIVDNFIEQVYRLNYYKLSIIIDNYCVLIYNYVQLKQKRRGYPLRLVHIKRYAFEEWY